MMHQRAAHLAVVAVALGVLLSFAGADDHPSTSGHSIHIAFGFHVNLYHSFRNDTNDEDGFGKDIRIIRHIIRTLDQFNASGVPVKGIWDFDNLFSLQEILPRHAPDIIDDIRRRVHHHGDEVILMSYNNGLVSAMNRRELDNAIRWSITNPWNSGVLDLFGKYTPIVRPQEMMTTPGNFTAYKAHGIEAVSLYYSATPFDTFRVFSRTLNRAEAHNPLRYHNPQTKEEMVVIPTYHFGDLLEHVSLKNWVNELRRLQHKGELKHDALLFINYDADSELWGDLDLPRIMDWLPNAGGLKALVDEVKDTPGVQFTTLGDYLAEHPPVGTISFSQDTADGSFNGYNSWSEKAHTSWYWTAIERSRRSNAAARKALPLLKGSIDAHRLQDLVDRAEIKRLRALSTTNFGMATPFLARQRELVMASMVKALDSLSDEIHLQLSDGLRRYIDTRGRPPVENHDLRILDTLLVLQSDRLDHGDGGNFFRLPVPEGYEKEAELYVIANDGRIHPAIQLNRHPRKTASTLNLYLANEDGLKDGIYHLASGTPAGGDHATGRGKARTMPAGMTNGRVSVKFEHGKLAGIELDGRHLAGDGSLTPHLAWSDRSFHASSESIEKIEDAHGRFASIRMTGSLPGPAARTHSQGKMDYTYTLLSDRPYLLIDADIHYPSTEKRDVLKADAPGLMRKADMNWREVAPAEVRFVPTATRDAPIRILKENYLGISTEYTLDYFRHSQANFNLDNVNNHITQSYVGLVAGNAGLAVAMDNSVQSNFAFAPVKMEYDRQDQAFSARINPFGTYYGNQYTPPTWGNGNGFDSTLVVGEQFASAGPTYNGVKQTFSMMLALFDGEALPETIRRDLVGFANPPVVVSLTPNNNNRPDAPSEAPPQGFVAAYENGAVQFSWDSGRNPEEDYRIYCGTSPGIYEAVYPATGNSLRMSRYKHGLAFEQDQVYYATIEKVFPGGRASDRAEEIRLTIQAPPDELPRIPLKLGLKVLWANMHAMVKDWRI